MPLRSLVTQLQETALTGELNERSGRAERLLMRGAGRCSRALVASALAQRRDAPLLVVVPTLEEHPFARQLAAGALVTLNSDDPAFFRFDLADEYARIAAAFDFGFDEMVAIRDRAIDAAWLDDVDKESLRSAFAG